MKTRLLTVAIALGLGLIGGGALLAHFFQISFLHGVYCAFAIGATDGCDVNSPSDAGRLVEILVILVSVPTMGYLFSRMTSTHIRNRIGTKLEEHRDEIKQLINGNTEKDNNNV